MKSTLTAYRRFPGTAREAMTFYHQIFGGDLEIQDFDGNPEQVMHSHIIVDGTPLVFAADMIASMELTVGEDTPIAITGPTESLDEVKGYWEALAEGGTVQMDFEAAPWGAYFGSLQDKFGTHWFFNVEG